MKLSLCVEVFGYMWSPYKGICIQITVYTLLKLIYFDEHSDLSMIQHTRLIRKLLAEARAYYAKPLTKDHLHQAPSKRATKVNFHLR